MKTITLVLSASKQLMDVQIIERNKQTLNVAIVQSKAPTIVLGMTLPGPPGPPGEGTYTNEAPTPTTVGGIAAGSTFKDRTVKDMFDIRHRTSIHSAWGYQV
jgi:hypothetical protein